MDNVLWKKKKNYIYTNTRWKDSITRKVLKVRCFSRRHMWNKENRENIFMMTASDIFYTLIKAKSIQMLHKVASQKKMECSDYQPTTITRVTKVIYS